MKWRLCCDTPVNDNLPAELRDVAERVAVEAADYVRRRRTDIFETGDADSPDAPRNLTAVRAKSGPTDPVTIADTEAEAAGGSGAVAAATDAGYCVVARGGATSPTSRCRSS